MTKQSINITGMPCTFRTGIQHIGSKRSRMVCGMEHSISGRMITLRRITDIESQQNKQSPTDAVHNGRRDAEPCGPKDGGCVGVERVERAVDVATEEIGEEKDEGGPDELED